MGRVRFSAVVDSRYVSFLYCKFEKSEGKGQRAGFLEAGGSFKAVLVVASLTLFPWEQPAGQLVPINLSPGGASALTGRRSWPTPWLAEGRGPRPRGLSPFLTLSMGGWGDGKCQPAQAPELGTGAPFSFGVLLRWRGSLKRTTFLTVPGES